MLDTHDTSWRLHVLSMMEDPVTADLQKDPMIDFDKMLDESRIVDLKAGTKEEALRELVDVLATSPEVTDKDELLTAIFEREKVISTGVGIEVALPHVKISSVRNFAIAV